MVNGYKKKKKSKTASVKKNQIKTHKRLKHERVLKMWTRQNNLNIFGIMLPLTKRHTDRQA